MESFVVGLRTDEVLRRRATVRRTRLIGGSVVLVLTTIGLGLAVALTIMLGEFWFIGLLMIFSMLLLATPTVKAMRVSAALKRWYDASELPPFALRMSPVALELGVEGAPAPVVLPWQAVQGFRLQRRYGQQTLEVVLRPNVSPTSPGISGLDQLAAQASLQPGKWLKSAGLYGVASLDQPVEAINQALQHFSRGAVGVS